MAFRFRMEKVLSVRRIEEDAARTRHARARDRLERAERACEALERRRQRCERELDDLKGRDALTAESLHLYALHRAGLARAQEAAAEELAEARAEAARTRSALTEAHQAREAMERLREKERAAWQYRQGRKEAALLDELAVAQHRSNEEDSHGP